MKMVVTFLITTLSALAMANASVTGAGLSSDPNAVGGANVKTTDDQEQSWGGRGLNCNTGTVTCSSGRAISCYTTLGNVNHSSLCTQRTGNVAYVRCQAFDVYGNLTSLFYDECP